MARPTSADRTHAAAMLLAALATAIYWALFFGAGLVQTAHDPAYLAFERAFPLADGYMAFCFVVSALLLLRGKLAAVPWGIAAGSAMLYLGGMDVLFNLEHGKYADHGPEMLLELAINAACLGFGPFTMLRLWGRRQHLGSMFGR